MVNEFEEQVEEVEECGFVNTYSGVKLETDESLITSSKSGEVYDWAKLPEYSKAPPRINLDNKIVIIEKAELILPSEDFEWKLTKTNKKKYKPVKFVLYYNVEAQQESYSGVKVFLRVDKGKEKYSIPTIFKEGGSQAAILLDKYAKFKNKNVNEISFKELMCFLNSKPKAEVRTLEIKNPETNEIIMKNLVYKFIN